MKQRSNIEAVLLVGVLSCLILVCFGTSIWQLARAASTRLTSCCMPDDCSKTSSASDTEPVAASNAGTHSFAASHIRPSIHVPVSTEICAFDNVIAALLGCQAFYNRVNGGGSGSSGNASSSVSSNTSVATNATSAAAFSCKTTNAAACMKPAAEEGLRLCTVSAVINLIGSLLLGAALVAKIYVGSRRRSSADVSASPGHEQGHTQQQSGEQSGRPLGDLFGAVAFPVATLALGCGAGIAIAALNGVGFEAVTVRDAPSGVAFAAGCGPSLVGRTPLLVSAMSPEGLALPIGIAGALFPGLIFLSVIIASFCCGGNNNHHSATSNPITVVALFIKFGFDEAAVEHAKDQLEQQAAIKRKEEMRRAADAMLDGKESGALGGIDDDSNNIFAPANGAGASLLPRRSNPLQSRYYRDYEDSLQDSGSAGRLSPVPPQQQSQRPSAAAATSGGADGGGADPANPTMLMGAFPRRNVSGFDVPSSSEAERDNSPMIPLKGKDGKTVMVRASIPLEGRLDPALLRGLHGMNIASESEAYDFTDNEIMSRQGSVQPMLFARAVSPENFGSIGLSSTAAALPDSEIVDRRVLPPAAAGQKPVVIAAVKPGARRADAGSAPDMRNRPQHHHDSLDDDDSGAEALNESSRRVFIHSASVKGQSTPKATSVTAPPTPAGSSRSLKTGGHGGHAAPLPPVVAGAENDFMDDL